MPIILGKETMLGLVPYWSYDRLAYKCFALQCKPNFFSSARHINILDGHTVLTSEFSLIFVMIRSSVRQARKQPRKLRVVGLVDYSAVVVRQQRTPPQQKRKKVSHVKNVLLLSGVYSTLLGAPAYGHALVFLSLV